MLAGRVGPALRGLCAADRAGSDLATAIVAALDAACAALPPQLCLAARVMFAIEPGYDDSTLTGRQSRLAAFWGVDPITVRRRCDAALRQIVAHLADSSAGPMSTSDDLFDRHAWYLASSSALLRLDRPNPEASRVLTVVAMKDGLESVALGCGVPRRRDEPRTRMALDVEILFGGVLESGRRLSAEYFVHRVRLPHALGRGEQHTLGVLTRIPHGQLMAPHLVVWAHRRTDRLEVRVRFDHRRLPAAVWRARGIPFPLSEADGPSGELLRPAGVGEVAVAFERLVTGLGYGVGWLPR